MLNQDSPSPTPLNILHQAIKAVPAVRWALGVSGILAVIAIAVSAWKINLIVAVLGVPIMLVLMTGLVIFAALANDHTVLVKPAFVLTWFSLVLVMATASALFTSIFLDKPIPLKKYFFSKPSQGNESDFSTKMIITPTPTPFQHRKPKQPTVTTDKLGSLAGKWQTGNRVGECWVNALDCKFSCYQKLELTISGDSYEDFRTNLVKQIIVREPPACAVERGYDVQQKIKAELKAFDGKNVEFSVTPVKKKYEFTLKLGYDGSFLRGTSDDAKRLLPDTDSDSPLVFTRYK